jgi:8-oxo-dGTP pyrophosphatase MutT (NUDIX family)
VVEPSGIPAPVAAATVLLLRDEPQGGFSVFMVQRSMKSSFMPGAYVFPGGKVDPQDYGQPVDLDDDAVLSRFDSELSLADARAHLVAAVREVAEEAFVSLESVAGMQVFSRWVTPAIESRRFDTWFLIAKMPAGARPRHDDHEVVASRWVQPRAAVEHYGDGTILLAPPTFYTLSELARSGSATAAIDAAAKRKVTAIQPRFAEVGGRMTLLLPGDPLYPSERPVGGPTRIVMGEAGRWWVVDPSRSTPWPGSEPAPDSPGA